MVAPHATCKRPPRPLATQPVMFALEAQPKLCIIPAASGSQLLMTQYMTASGAPDAAAGAPAKFNAEHLNMLAGLQQSATSFQRQINHFSKTFASHTECGDQIKGCSWNETGAKKPHPSCGTERPLGRCSQLAALQPAPCLQVRALRSQVCQQRLVLSRRTSKENG